MWLDVRRPAQHDVVDVAAAVVVVVVVAAVVAAVVNKFRNLACTPLKEYTLRECVTSIG